ncbi:MAG: glutamate formimidoyltransferase [Sulfobacillus sp.]|nr:glutamate formimidoyltransferase [Sulfobacillus sp.]
MWIESIPNFSEGRDTETLEALKRSVDGIPGVYRLGFEADPDHHRSVMTLAGEPTALVEALVRVARVAVERIDLRRHQGTHPRIGAVDVIPFVPLSGASLPDAVSVSRRLGERLAAELQLPVFYYEASALKPERKNLAAVRRGQFEGLADRMAEDPPDVGPIRPHPSAGAVAVGARRPLIAFNAYLDTQDLAVAERVARAVRHSSGGLAGVKALAMDTRPSHGMVQVSMNLVDYPTTPLPRALDLVRVEAQRWGTRVVRTELIGFMPMAAVEDIVRHYLGLWDFDRFRIVEEAVRQATDPS